MQMEMFVKSIWEMETSCCFCETESEKDVVDCTTALA
jgi:hypothetical protein